MQEITALNVVKTIQGSHFWLAAENLREILGGCGFCISLIQSCTQPSLLAYKLSLSPLVTGSTNTCHLEPAAESVSKRSTLTLGTLQ